jgi:hypothetical protein
MTGILDWTEVVLPNVPQFIVASGPVDNVLENEATGVITCNLNLPQYLQALGGSGSFPIIGVIDMKSSRWKPVPPANRRRAPYLKTGSYATVSGPLSGITMQGGVVSGFQITATDAVPLGKAPNHLPSFDLELTSESDACE